MRRAALTSVGFHIAVLGMLLAGFAWLPHPTPSAPTDGPQIEMLSQPSLTGDTTTETPPAAPDPAPPDPAPLAAAPLAAAPWAAAPQPVVPPPPAALAPPPALIVPMPPAPTARELLDQSIGTAIATGLGVIPPAPDSRRNAPPRYPDDAKRHGEQGRVLLVLHVAPDGHVARVDLERTSGSASLDQAATDAVLHWHFHPALAGKNPVDATFETEVVFQFTDKK